MAQNIETYYRILELPLNASNDDIRIRYRQMARVYHPDRYNDPVDKEFVEAMMKRVNEAYNTLLRTPRPHVTQVAPPAQAPTIYRTVKGIPTFMALMLIGVAFVIGAITVQFLSFNFLAHATLNKAALALEASQLASEQCISQTVASATTVAIAENPTQSEPLAVEVSGIGMFPLRTSATDTNQAPVVEPIAPVSPTDTPVPTATAIPTDTPAPPPSDTPTTPPPPSPTAEPATPTTVVHTPAMVRTDAGVLYTINNPFSVYARTATSIQSEPAALLATGKQILVTGRTMDNTWLRIVLENGDPAWIYAESAGATHELIAALPIVNP
ncbi:MAG: J domain-containing protein [Caldilineaceae bacterium]